MTTHRHAEGAEVANGENKENVVTTKRPFKDVEVARTVDNTEVVASPRSSREDDVAIEKGVEPHPFWDLLRQAGYDCW